ncbi:MAG: undecaprenyl-diphosphate phosphatase [Planctomycetes bacterium]|nr:undecaprenyl-diphosphate phosphatase [Planctomycetota bacterium]
MEWWQALILGVVEGITEFLPVSSTGHLLVVQRLLGLEANDGSNAYAICIQAGAIAAVLGLYRLRVRQAALGLAGRDPKGARLLQALLVAFLPAALVGVLFDDTIEQHLFGLWPIVAAWTVGGIAIVGVSRTTLLRPPPVEQEGEGGAAGAPPSPFELDPTTRQALVIGLAQVLALWPGTSRSLVTILAGVLVGLPLAAAVEFSFLLGVLTLGAATAYKALQHGDAILALGPGPVVLGAAAAWLSAVVAVRWMVEHLRRRGLGLFAAWRLGAAALVAGLLLAGVLQPT